MTYCMLRVLEPWQTKWGISKEDFSLNVRDLNWSLGLISQFSHFYSHPNNCKLLQPSPLKGPLLHTKQYAEIYTVYMYLGVCLYICVCVLHTHVYYINLYICINLILTWIPQGNIIISTTQIEWLNWNKVQSLVLYNSEVCLGSEIIFSDSTTHILKLCTFYLPTKKQAFRYPYLL